MFGLEELGVMGLVYRPIEVVVAVEGDEGGQWTVEGFLDTFYVFGKD